MQIFSKAERAKLLSVRGIGPTVITRLETMGISTLAQLARCDEETICRAGATLTGSSCWANSPSARKAIRAAIDMAANAENDTPASLLLDDESR